jgi:hypothetical protein
MVGANMAVLRITRRRGSGRTASTFVIACRAAVARCSSANASAIRAPRTSASISSLVKVSGGNSNPFSRR